MSLKIFGSSRVLIYLIAGMLVMGAATSCKSKKKLAREQAAAEYAAKVEQAKNDLTAMLNGTTNWTLDQQNDRLNEIKSYNIDDPEVKTLIDQVEKKIQMDMAEADRLAEEERLRKIEEQKLKEEAVKYEAIDTQLKSISTSSTIDAANKKIMLSMDQFASPDVPVLVIISQAGGFNDYDRPTTISKFLHYLKDKQQYKYQVVSVKKDALGKITELELLKK